MTTITAKATTFIKRLPLQSTQLTENDKIAFKIGQTLNCKLTFKVEKGHQLIELETPLRGYYNWWLFSSHWDTPFTEIKPSSIEWTELGCPVSRFFTVNDVIQGDYRRIPHDPSHIKNIIALAKELDKIRDSWGSAIGVTSWYRPEPINSQVGGVPGSTHTLGMAADIFPYHGDGYAFEEWLDEFWGNRALGYGQRAGRGFTHVDLRDGFIRWDY